jgi:thiamine biosynthesis lipoprotein
MSVPSRSIPSQAAIATSLVREQGYFHGRFAAMASPCELLIDSEDRAVAAAMLQVVEDEARRIERKFSRYRPDNIVSRINHANGGPVTVDEETARLIDYAATCHAMSDGLFDITSGVLRRVWKFDGGDQVPDPTEVRAVLEHVGWHRVSWADATLRLEPGMEIDLGGVGKEYAVDRAAALVAARTARAFLVNFGGDLYASSARRDGKAWAVGVDDPEHTGEQAIIRVDLTRGGLATSGDARRFVMWNGKRLGHILNPRTGWPIEDAPRSVTVLAGSATEAGTLSTLAYLRGAGAAEFLREQGAQFWVV